MSGDSFSVLFVCLGNICRSPAADGVFSELLRKSQVAGTILCDSCGTGDWHIGQLPDLRMRAAGARRGYNFNHKARQLCGDDYRKFDLILAMDQENFSDILSRAPNDFDPAKLKMFTDFCTGKFSKEKFVPDPYYGGEVDFDLALDIIENGCQNLLDFSRINIKK